MAAYQINLKTHLKLVGFLLSLTNKELEMLEIFYNLELSKETPTNLMEYIEEKSGLKYQTIANKLSSLRKKKALDENNQLTSYSNFRNKLTFICHYT